MRIFIAATGEIRDMTEQELADHEASFLPSNSPPPVPASITRRQARLALLLAGHLDDIEPMIDAIKDPLQRRVAQIEWDEATTVERASPLVAMLGAGLGLSIAQLDALFISAEQL